MAEDLNYKNVNIAYKLKNDKKTNSHTPAIKSLPYSTPRALTKICGKLISR